MATILRTIAPTGGDYTSLASWEAGEQTDLVSAGDSHIAEIQGDWSAGADTGVVSINGWTTDSTHGITIRTDSANKAGAKWDASKYVLAAPNPANGCIGVYFAHVRVVGLQVFVESTTSSVVYAFRTFSGSGQVLEIDQCYVRGNVNGGTGAIIGVSVNTANVYNVICTRSVFKDCANGTTFSYAMALTADAYSGNHVVYSNTIYGCTFGIRTATYATLIKNNLVAAGTSGGGSGVYDFHGTFATGSDYNATTSTDTVGTGSNNISSATVVFRDVANHDLHITNGSTSIIDAGTDLSADATWPLEAVDIDGEARSSWDIGADEWSPLEVVRTVTPNAPTDGGDYSSLSAWEAGEQADIVTADETHVAEIRGDWSGGPDTVGVAVAGWTMDSDHRVTIRTDSANRAGAAWDSTRYVLQSNGAQCVNIQSGSWVNLDGLQIRNTRNATFTRAIFLNQGTGREVNISNCFVVGNYAQAGNALIFNNYVTGGDQVTNVWNTIVTYIDLQSSNGMGFYNQTTGGYYYNCLAYNTDDGFKRNGGTSYVKNCIAANNPNSGFYNWPAGSDYNTSSDATAPGANSQTNVTPTFMDAAGLDFRLSPYDTIAQGNGVSLYADGVTTDIEGTSRGTASATAYDIGAHHQTQMIRTIKPSGQGGDYTSLSTWEAAEQSDLVANNKSHTAEAQGDWSAASDSGVTIGGWTSDSTHRITVTTDSANRATAGYDSTKFKTGFVSVYVDHTLVYGVQVRRNTTALLIAQAGTTNITFSRCFLYYNGTSSTGLLIQLYGTLGLAVNCSIWGSNPSYGRGVVGGNGVNYAYNCSMYGLNMAYRRTSGTFRAVNCLYDNIGFNSFSNEDTCYGGTGYTTGTVPFADPTNTTAPDLHLASSDANIVGAATDMTSDPLWGFYGYTEDADGDTRSSWDIGADEYVASGGGGTTHNAAGTSDAIGTAGATASLTRAALALCSSAASVVAAATVLLSASCAVAASSTASASTSSSTEAAGIINASSTASASASTSSTNAATGAITASSTASASASTTKAAVGEVAAFSTAHAWGSLGGGSSTAISCSSSVTGSAALYRPASGLAGGSSSASGAVLAIRGVATLVQAQSSTVGAAGRFLGVSCSMQAASSVTAQLRLIGEEYNLTNVWMASARPTTASASNRPTTWKAL